MEPTTTIAACSASATSWSACAADGLATATVVVSNLADKPETQERLKARVAAELTTTFASHYAQSVSLAQMLVPETIAIYNRRATGTKYLVTPNG